MGWDPWEDITGWGEDIEEALDPETWFDDGAEEPTPPPAVPEPSEAETALLEAITDAITAGERPLSETQLAIEELTLAMLEQQMTNLPMQQEQWEAAHDIFMQQIEEYNSPEAQARRELSAELIDFQMEQIQAARDLGEITGDLSEQEMAALNTMETNAIQTLTSTVQEQTEEMMGKTIAQMVDRGVLQGDIGARAMTDIGEASAEAIAQGTAAITSQKMGAIIGMGEAQKGRQLQMQGMVQAGAMGREAAQQQWAGQAFGLTGGQQAAQQQFAQTASQFSAGMAQDWEKTQLGAGMQMWGGMAGQRESAADRALNLSIAQMQARAAREASQWGAFGNVAGMAGMGYLMSSRNFKKDIEELDEATEQKILDKIKDVKIYTYKYKDEIDADGKEYTGIVTEEAPQEIVTSDGKHLDVISYFGYLTTCIKVLAQKVDQLTQEKAHA